MANFGVGISGGKKQPAKQNETPQIDGGVLGLQKGYLRALLVTNNANKNTADGAI